MKQLLSVLVMLFLLSGVALAQTKTAAKGPVMTLETTEVDYGKIDQGAEPLRVFKFKNTGDQPLQITNARGSCGCTVPKWPKDPIFPGESGVIEVRYDTQRTGPFNKNVTLTTNETVGTRVLTIKGEVKAKPAEKDAVPQAAPSILNPNG